MIWAIKEGKKFKATPNDLATCPCCNTEVLAKCGTIKIWHWSHKTLEDCDKWYEPESEWHIEWKNEFPENMQEVTIGKHRADILTKEGEVIELQNSSISVDEIKSREEFYDNMSWLLNGYSLARGLNLRNKGNFYSFRWKHPAKSWWYAKKKIYIHLKGLLSSSGNFIEERSEFFYDIFGLGSNPEDYIFEIVRIYSNVPCGGWGKLIKKEEFLSGKRD